MFLRHIPNPSPVVDRAAASVATAVPDSVKVERLAASPRLHNRFGSPFGGVETTRGQDNRAEAITATAG